MHTQTHTLGTEMVNVERIFSVSLGELTELCCFLGNRLLPLTLVTNPSRGVLSSCVTKPEEQMGLAHTTDSWREHQDPHSSRLSSSLTPTSCCLLAW